MTTTEAPAKTTVAATALLAVLALTGCGTSTASNQADHVTTAATALSKAAYSAELRQVGTSLVTALNSLGQKSEDFTRIERNVPRGQAALRHAAARLAATTPPTDARTDNTKLVAGLRFFAVQLTKMRTAAARHDLKAVVAADSGLDRSPAVRAMMAAAAELQHKGYKLGQLAPSNKP
jgi:hypothetical protein